MTTRTFRLWLEFEVWQPAPDGGDDLADDCFNMMITMNTGAQYALNVWTYKFVQRAWQVAQQEGTNIHGKYLLPPD